MNEYDEHDSKFKVRNSPNHDTSDIEDTKKTI